MHCFVQNVNVLRALCFMCRRQISRPWERLPSSSFSFTSFVLSTFSEFLMLVSTSILSFAGKTIPFKFLRTSAGKFTIKYCSLSFLFLSLSLKLSARPPAAAAVPVSEESFQIMNMRRIATQVGWEGWAIRSPEFWHWYRVHHIIQYFCLLIRTTATLETNILKF